MGKIKNNSQETKEYELTTDEFNYLKILNYALQTSVLKDKVISGYLHMLCRLKYDYEDNINLTFEIDLGAEDRKLKVKEVTNDQVAENFTERA